MSLRHCLLVFFIAWLGACSEQDRELHLDLSPAAGLRPGSPVMLDGQVVGSVTTVKPNGAAGESAMLAIRPQFRGRFTRDTRFVIARDPAATDARRVEIQAGSSGTPPLAEGARVLAEKAPEPKFPFGEMLRGMTEGLGILRDHVEQFRTQLQKLPQSPEAQRLKEEWLRLQDEMKKAQEVTQDAVRKDIVPKLQQEMDGLEKRFRELEAKPAPRPM